MTTKEPISKERIVELKSMSIGFYGTIHGITEDPYEALVLITMIHMMFWMNHRIPGSSTKEMLDDYSANFLENMEQNEAIEKGRMQ
jgi:hypothetical protein